MKKLEIIGDSILKGVTYNADTNRYKLYGSTLDSRLAERGVEVSRACRMGATVEQGSERLKKILESGDDLTDTHILLEFGGNDCDYVWSEVSASPDTEHTPRTAPERFAAVYSDMIKSAQERGAKVTLASLVPIDAQKYMNFITRGLSYDNILRWLGDVSMLYRWHEGYSRAVESFARSFSCPVLDLRGLFLGSHDFSGLLCADGIHPTVEGHKMIEDTIVKAFSM